MITPMVVNPDDSGADDTWFSEVDDLTKSNEMEKANPVYKVYLIYKFIKKHKNKEETITDKRWDKLNSARELKHCKRILDAYDKDVKAAAKAVFEIGEYFEKCGVTWTCSSVYNRITDWEEGRLDK